MTNGTSTRCSEYARRLKMNSTAIRAIAHERNGRCEREHEQQCRIDGYRPGRACELRKELGAEERRIVRRIVQINHQERARARLQKEPRRDYRERKARV